MLALLQCEEILNYPLFPSAYSLITWEFCIYIFGYSLGSSTQQVRLGHCGEDLVPNKLDLDIMSFNSKANMSVAAS